MYITLQDQDDSIRFVWDTSKQIMYEVEEGITTRILATIHGLEKHRPYLQFISEERKKPEFVDDSTEEECREYIEGEKE